MKINNKSKTKILKCSKQELLSNIIENEKLETVKCFTYLGSNVPNT